MKTRIFTIILTLFALAAAGCTASPKAITGTERDAVLTYTEPKADNELVALNAKDYDAFIKDYDAAMREATTPDNFNNLTSLISQKLGSYISREVISVASIGDNNVLVVYSAKFEEEDGVTIRMVFQSEGDHLITGLWFDSPKLREQ
jgi:hypothetical protein